jgi:hypothetical protein
MGGLQAQSAPVVNTDGFRTGERLRRRKLRCVPGGSKRRWESYRETAREICRLDRYHRWVERWGPRANGCTSDRDSPRHHAGALDERAAWQFGKLLWSG